MFNIEKTPPWIKAIALSTKEYLAQAKKINIAINRFLKMLLNNVIIIKAKTTCPTVIFATNRTANVIGRKNCLINSTIDKIGERDIVTPLGIKCLKKFL